MDGIPDEAVALGFDPGLYTMGDQVSFRGPCLHCGGSRRMVVFINGDFPQWYIRCDMCGSEGWLDQFFPRTDLERIVQTVGVTHFNRDLSEQRNSDLERNIALLDSMALWKKYHGAMDDNNREWWRKAGIPDEWQDFWCLGYTPERTFKHEGVVYNRPAYTIPKMEMGWKIRNVDYRLVDPPLGVGKYRPEYGLPAAAFISRPDLSNGHSPDLVIVTEGSKKAMVTSLHLDGMQVYGVPAARSWAGVDQRLKDGPDVIVVLDPDAEKAARKLTKTIGRRARYLHLPTKIDDAFINGYLTRDTFWSIVELNAQKV